MMVTKAEPAAPRNDHAPWRWRLLRSAMLCLTLATGCRSGHLGSARDFSAKRQYADALREYQLALQEDSRLSEDRGVQKEIALAKAREIYRQGRVLEERGKIPEAVLYYQDTLVVLDSLLSATGRMETAGGRPEEMLARLGKNRELEFLYGQDVREAAAALQRARAASVEMLLRQAASKAGDGDVVLASRLVKEAAGIAPEDAEVRKALASLDVDSSSETEQTAANRLYLAGVSLQNKGDWDGASRKYAEVLVEEPSHLRALASQAILKREMSKLEEQLIPVRQALQEHRLESAARMLRQISLRARPASVSELQRQGAAASQAFTEALAESESLARNGRWDDALAQLGKAGELNSESRLPDYAAEQIRAAARSHYEAEARQRIADNRHAEALAFAGTAAGYLPSPLRRQVAWRQFFLEGSNDLLQRRLPGAAWIWLRRAQECGAAPTETANLETACRSGILALHHRPLAVSSAWTAEEPAAARGQALATALAGQLRSQAARHSLIAPETVPETTTLQLTVLLKSLTLAPLPPLKAEKHYFRKVVNGRPITWTTVTHEYSRYGEIRYASLKATAGETTVLSEPEGAWSWNATGELGDEKEVAAAEGKILTPPPDEAFEQMFLEKLAEVLLEKTEQAWIRHELAALPKAPSAPSDAEAYSQRLELAGERLVLLQRLDPLQAEAEWKQWADREFPDRQPGGAAGRQ